MSAIYFIGVLDFLYEEKKNPKFRRDITLKDQDNEPFYHKLQLTYLQMPAFNKTVDELETHFDKWAYFLKNLEDIEDIPQILKEPIFEQAFKTAKVANFNAQQRSEYEKSRMAYISLKQVTATAEEDGLQRGMELGIAIGEQKGEAKGKAEGIAEGIAFTKSVFKLHLQGLSAEKIAEQLGVETKIVTDLLAEE